MLFIVMKHESLVVVAAIVHVACFSVSFLCFSLFFREISSASNQISINRAEMLRKYKKHKKKQYMSNMAIIAHFIHLSQSNIISVYFSNKNGKNKKK